METENMTLKEHYKKLLSEAAAPGKEKWASDPKVKASFKKQYGSRWKQVMYGHSWNMKENIDSNEGMLLNELGDTPAGRKALSSYISKRAKQVRGPMRQRVNDIGANVTKSFDSFHFRMRNKLPTINAFLASKSHLANLEKATGKLVRAETGISRAMNTLYPRKK